MKYLTILFILCHTNTFSQDTATISINKNGKQYFVRIGYNPDKVDSIRKERKFDTSYSESRGIRIDYRDNIIKYYTGMAVIYTLNGKTLTKTLNEVKVYLPIDYYDNDKFITYLKRKIFK